LTEEERQLRLRLRDDFPHYAAKCLKIRTKSGAVVPFQMNQAQVYVHQKLEEQKAKTGKVRALILKARQQGFSTYIGGRFYHQVTHRVGCQVFILTHEDDATSNLFQMVERYHEHNNPLVKPATSADNAKELRFHKLDSGYSVGTAGSKARGRSKTVQLFHGSEVAFWPNASTHFAGVVQAIPDLPGTEVILESTANGIGGEFHERWQQAEAGIGDYQAIFVPWFWTIEYRRPVPEGFHLNEEEAEYAEMHNLDLEQMVWRRAKIAELKDASLFKQEYPATAQEAFQMTGHDSFINTASVLAARKSEIEPAGPLVIGVDPARYGDDSFAIAWRRGRKVLKVERRHKLDVVQGANWVRSVIEKDEPVKAFIDVGGLGAGVYDIVRDFGGVFAKAVEAVNFGGSPTDPPEIAKDGATIPGPKNRRAEMWARSKAWLEEEGGADIPDDDALHADACAPGYRHDMQQRLLIEEKDAIRRRGFRSPDGWDAVALTFAAPVKDAKGDEGRRYGKRKPVKRSAWAA
jgi:hypothetical protein